MSGALLLFLGFMVGLAILVRHHEHVHQQEGARMNWDLSIRARMMIGFGLILGLLLMLLGMTVRGLVRIGNEQRQIVHVIGERADLADIIKTAFLSRAISIHSYIATREPNYLKIYRKEQNTEQDAIGRLLTFPATADGVKIRDRILTVAKDFDRLANQALALVDSGATQREIDPIENRLRELRTQLIDATRQYSALQTGRRMAADTAMDGLVSDMLVHQILFSACILALCVVVALLTIHAVRHPAARLAVAIGALEHGDYGPALDLVLLFPHSGGKLHNELHAVACAFGRMADVLRRREARQEADSRVATLLTANLDLGRLAAGTLREALAYVRGGEAGAVYLREGDQLRRLAQQQFAAAPQALPAGEGIAGRAVAELRPVITRDAAAAAPFLPDAGADPGAPVALTAVPILFQNQAGGAIVLRCGAEPGADELEYLEHAASHLGISLQNALAHVESTRLAEELKSKNTRLRAQNEMLHAQQDQLKTQSEQLQQQNEEIQQQSEEIQAQNAEMQRTLESLRSSELLLRRQAAELAEADRRKDEFLAMLAHELRNPLAAISNANYVLAKAPPGTPQAERLRGVVTRQVRHLARMVDDLLDVSRITRGKVVLRREPVELRRLIENAVESCRGMIEDGGLKLEVALPPEKLTLEADPTRLEQMIGNLLHNAIKFTEPGGVIRLSAASEEGWAVLRIRDTGIGIGPETLPRVFDLFAQADRGPDRAKGGLGIGLTLVRTLAELHGGQVEATSEGIGHGSEFVLRLPALANVECGVRNSE